MTHYLKCWPEYFTANTDGVKTFEVRRNDRDFQAGDVLQLNEWDPATERETGRILWARVLYVLYGPQFGIAAGFCVMSIERVPLL